MKARLVFLILIVLQSPCIASNWPDVKSSSDSELFNIPERARYSTFIKGVDGKDIYYLSCQSGEMEETNDFNYSGLFQCRLISLYSKEQISTLLIEDMDQTADWEGRSRFFLDHVVGDCALTPDWGTKRAFKLRKMLLVLSIDDVSLTGTIASPDLKAFRFSYSVKPDKRALSSIAKPSPVPKPRWFDGEEKECVRQKLK